MKQYRMQPGTSQRIYYVLTVMDDETMTLTFHGTDREMTEVVKTREDGWIVTPRGGLYPPVSHSRWQEEPHPQPLPRREGNGCASRSRRRCNSGHTDTPDIDAARNQRSAAADHHHDTEDRQESRHCPLPTGEGLGVGLWPAVAAFAAACVGLVVVYESGLLIPVGLIGAVAGGILR